METGYNEGLLLFISLVAVFMWLPYLATRLKKRWLTTVSRWLRWLLIGSSFAYFVRYFELSFRPDWVHFITGLGLWFALETFYNWLGIKALSKSSIPLFPQYTENKDGDDWPADKASIEVKEWIRENGFERLQSLKAEILPGTVIRSSIYENPKSHVRLQVLFFPQKKGVPVASYSFITDTDDEKRIITENQFLPYGGYYPENWTVQRFPLTSSIRRLFAKHDKTLKKQSVSAVAIEDNALEYLETQQRVLEKVNVERGFLVPRPLREEFGRITSDGCFRLWKEMWFLAYLGRSVS